jgi:hypothetical protein
MLPREDKLSELLSQPYAVRLLQALAGIQEHKVRQAFVQLAESIASRETVSIN